VSISNSDNVNTKEVKLKMNSLLANEIQRKSSNAKIK